MGSMNKKNIGLRMTSVMVLIGLSAARGDVTYTLQFDPASSVEAQQVATAIAEAVPVINQYGSFNKHWNVYQNPGIPTAEGSYDGYMGYGGTRNTRVVFHEGAHTFGMGTTAAYASLISGGVWGGLYGNQAQFDTFNTYADGLHGDGHAIWPGGFNYDNEDGFIERIWMLRVMAGIRADMGILSFTREAENEVVHPGGTAEFRVESPVAAGYQWYKGAVALTNGGDISGATGPTLRIAHAEAADGGAYHCAATGAGETLNSRPRQLLVVPRQQLGQWDMNGTVSDSVNVNPGTAFGAPVYTAGRIGQAIDLDGVNDYVTLPPAVGQAKDITVATWVHWDGGSNWQRIFDFGTGAHQYMFLTPKSGSGTLRLTFLDAVNGVSSEQRVDTTALPVGQWVHLTAVLNGEYATLYMNGTPVGSVSVPVTDPGDFMPTQNYIGKSQWPDPLFDGRIDDFRIYNHALTGSEVWNLWGQSGNRAPEFTTNPLAVPSAVGFDAYFDVSLTNHVYDADGDSLIYSKIGGPAWLSIAPDGVLSGTPDFEDFGTNTFYVRVLDSAGASADAALEILVEPVPIDYEAGPVAYWNFADAGAANDTFMPGNGDRADLDGDGAMDSDDFRIGSTDLSGNGNHLTAWTGSWMKWSATSVAGDFSMIANNSYPAAGTDSAYNPFITDGIDAEQISPAQWTVEAVFRPTALGGNQTIVGRDGSYPGPWGNYAALYLSTRGTELAVEYVDAAGNHHNLQVAAGLANGVWHHVAATSDGSTLRLWLDDAEIGNLDLSGSADPALAIGFGTWTVARGMFDGRHEDRFAGYIDAVAISGVALAPGSFVITGTWPSRYAFYMDRYGISDALFGDDANNNGVPNGMEYYLGWDPDGPGTTHQVLTLSRDYRSVSHPFNPAASGVIGRVEWTSALSSNGWNSAGITYTTNTASDTIEAMLGSTTTNQLFIRLKVEHEVDGKGRIF